LVGAPAVGGKEGLVGAPAVGKEVTGARAAGARPWLWIEEGA